MSGEEVVLGLFKSLKNVLVCGFRSVCTYYVLMLGALESEILFSVHCIGWTDWFLAEERGGRLI